MENTFSGVDMVDMEMGMFLFQENVDTVEKESVSVAKWVLVLVSVCLENVDMVETGIFLGMEKGMESVLVLENLFLEMEM